MKKLRKWKSRALVIATLFCMMVMMVPGSAVAAGTFNDTGSHWAKDTIESWAEKGYVSGYQDGSFKPDQYITRAEFMVIVNKAFCFTETEPINFSDVKARDWYHDTIAAAKAAGYISGDPAGTIRPDDPITREEAASIIMRLKNLAPDEEAASQFSDAALMSWSKGGVGAVADAGIMKGYPEGSFQPQRFITRAEAIVALDAALKYSAADPDTPAEPEEPVIPGAPDVTANDSSNKVDGMTTAMEYKLDDGQWISYDAEEFAKLDLSGKHTLLVRYAADGVNPAGPATTLQFTNPRSGGGGGSKTITTPKWVATGDLIRPDKKGPIYISFKLMNGTKQITLTDENIASFQVLEPGAEEPTDLIPDADPLLWFDVFQPAGDYVYTIETKAGAAYTATLDWAGLFESELVPTGAVGIHDNKISEAYALLYDAEQIPLSADNAAGIIEYDPNSEDITALTPDTDPLLWFNVEKSEAYYEYILITSTGKLYYAVFEWDGLLEASLEATDEHVVRDGITYVEYEMLDEEGRSILLNQDSVSIIAQRNPQGEWTALEDNTDATLWFDQERPTISYDFIVINQYARYRATLDWIVFTDQIINGGFETGDFEGWLVHRRGVFPEVQSDTVSAGEYASFMGDGADGLGLYDRDEGWKASIAQYISIANNASTPWLTMDYKVEGQDEEYDWMKVLINDTEIAYWWSDSDGWQNFSYDLSEFIGKDIAKDIELRIECWTRDDLFETRYYVDNVSIDYITPPAVEITGFDAIPDVDGGTAGAATYADAAAVITYLNSNITEVKITGTTDTVRVSNWTETDTYAAAEGSYTFTGTLGILPEGYVDEVDPITTVTVEVVIAAVPLGTDASLTALRYYVGETWIDVPGFASNILSYDITLPAGTTTVPALSHTLSDSKASFVVTHAKSLPGTTTFVVTAEDGTTTKTYTINFTVADIEITGFDAIPNVDAGTAGAATYADAAAVQAILPANVTANSGAVTVPVTSWTDTDSYKPNTAGSYTFTAVLGTIPAGYVNTVGYTAEVEVVVAAAATQTGAPAFTAGVPGTFETEMTVGSGTLSTTTNLQYTWYRSANSSYEVTDTMLTTGTSYTPVAADLDYYLIVAATTPDILGEGIVVTDTQIARKTIDIAAIQGVTPPVTGETPVTEITGTTQYTGTVAWLPDDNPFQASKVYKASIIISPKTGYTWAGIADNFFTVAGASPVYSTGGVISADFPTTEAAQNPIILTADTTLNDVDHEIDITFTADDNFANAITSVSFNDVSLTENTDYTVSGDKVTLKPDGNSVLRTPATAYVVISATGYTDQSVEQTITAGAANYIEVTREAVPGANGEIFATQPEITIYDQYSNICADGPSSGAYVYAGSGGPNLTIYGGTGINATEGVVTYTDLECWASSPGTGTIIFELIDGTINLYVYFNFTLPAI